MGASTRQIDVARDEVFDSIALPCYDAYYVRAPHQLRVNGSMSREVFW